MSTTLETPADIDGREVEPTLGRFDIELDPQAMKRRDVNRSDPDARPEEQHVPERSVGKF